MKLMKIKRPRMVNFRFLRAVNLSDEEESKY